MNFLYKISKACIVLAVRWSLPVLTFSFIVGSSELAASLMNNNLLQRLPHVALTCWALSLWFFFCVITQQRTRTRFDNSSATEASSGKFTEPYKMTPWRFPHYCSKTCSKGLMCSTIIAPNVLKVGSLVACFGMNRPLTICQFHTNVYAVSLLCETFCHDGTLDTAIMVWPNDANLISFGSGNGFLLEQKSLLIFSDVLQHSSYRKGPRTPNQRKFTRNWRGTHCKWPRWKTYQVDWNTHMNINERGSTQTTQQKIVTKHIVQSWFCKMDFFQFMTCMCFRGDFILHVALKTDLTLLPQSNSQKVRFSGMLTLPIEVLKWALSY